MPDAARVTDFHSCPMFDGPKPHLGGPILPPCAPTVQTGFFPQARISDLATCASAPDVIAQGSTTVWVIGLFAARMMDQTVHGGKIMVGFPTVEIGGPVFTARAVTRDGNDFTYGSGIAVSPDPNDPAYQSKVIAALIRLDTTPTGQAILNAIEGSGKTVTIEPYNNPRDPYNATTTPDLWPPWSAARGSTIAWNPGMDGFGPPGTTPDWAQPGSDIILGHELTHAAHNATNTAGGGPVNSDGVDVSEERNTTGLPAQTYTRPGDPLNGTALPDTQTGSPYNENALRNDYGNRGIPSPVTGQPPPQRPSYYSAPGTIAPGAVGTPF